MRKVLVFKTSVRNEKEVMRLSGILNEMTKPEKVWNFDLEDCDNILRVETVDTDALKIVENLKQEGFVCEELV